MPAITFLQTSSLAYLSKFLRQKNDDQYSVGGRMLLIINEGDGKHIYHKVILALYVSQTRD